MNRESQDPQGQAQDDVATLYSWANLAGTRYRDFSASRREIRSQARQRAAEQSAQVAELETVADPLDDITPEIPAADTYEESFDQAPMRNSSAAPVAEPRRDHEEPSVAGPRLGFLETALQEVMEPAAPSPMHHVPRAHHSAASPVTSPVPERPARWSALMGVFDPVREHRFPVAPQVPKLAVPVVAFFSLAGGVGKSSLVATLGRILAARGERVLLVDATPYGTLPFYYGASELRPGALRTFRGEGIEVPIQLLSLDANPSDPSAHTGWMTDLLQQYSANVDRILIDMGTASKLLAQAILDLAPTVIVPVVPDMSSMVSLQAVNSFFERSEPTSAPVEPYYLLNRFDPTAAMHEDIRALLHEQFGDRLMPLELRSSSDVSEALAEGVTVADYAPESPVNEDYVAIAEWIRQRATVRRKSRGVRWSEQ
ncbi:cellulose synthase operon protein YhjQ/BcsQ [Silvibacterium acidisoli]|uniref:cellulose synthase operon protein YhjQ/BcsQ n=1 Tax=Acidobacteriaceae bacterium ZG23-2 TaxID=2883246 RepID=UPI00406CC4A5